jgi:hypothetical protein
MTALEIYAFFILPFIVLALGGAAYWSLGRDRPGEVR